MLFFLFFLTFLSHSTKNHTGPKGPVKLKVGRNLITLMAKETLTFSDFPPQSFVLFPEHNPNILISCRANDIQIARVYRKLFGFHFGWNSGNLIIESLLNSHIDLVLYYIKIPNQSHDYYLSTYPEDVFVIVNPPDKFTVAKERAFNYITFVHITGSKSELSTSFLGDQNDVLLNVYFDNTTNAFLNPSEQNIVEYNQFAIMEWYFNSENKHRAFKVVAKCKDGLFPGARYSFNKKIPTCPIKRSESYGNYKLLKGGLPLKPLSMNDRVIQLKFETNIILAFGLCICILCLLIGIGIGMGCATTPAEIAKRLKEASHRKEEEEESLLHNINFNPRTS